MKFQFFLIILFIASFVSSYTIVCSEGEKGVQIWNLEQTFNESGWELEDLESEEGLNCTLIETSITLKEECQEFEPVIDQLNQRLKDNHIEIQTLENKQGRYTFYKVFSILFLLVSIILIFLMRRNTVKPKVI